MIELCGMNMYVLTVELLFIQLFYFVTENWKLLGYCYQVSKLLAATLDLLYKKMNNKSKTNEQMNQ